MLKRSLGGVLPGLAFALVLVSACSTGTAALPSSSAEAVAGPVTYWGAVKSIVDRRCVKCHDDGGVAPFPLTSFVETRRRAALISEEVTARRMPPWGALDTDECTPPLAWRHDERLSEQEIAVLRRWAAEGTPEGEPPSVTAAGAEPDPHSLALRASYDLAPRTPYLAPADGDDLRCFVIDLPPELAAGGYLSAIDVVPGDRSIVHHATVFADIGGESAAAAGPDGSFDCPGVEFHASRLAWLLSWAPGARPMALPSDVGIYLPADAKLLVQVHYSVGRREYGPDSTRVQLAMHDTKPTYVLENWSVGNMNVQLENGDGLLPQPDDAEGNVEFRIPAWATDHREIIHGTWPLPVERRLFGVRAHAHLVATDIKVDLLRANPTGPESQTQCLVQDRWDFHWQRVYTYDAPYDSLPVIRPGDRARLRCTYDNTTSNVRLGSELYLRGLRPTDVFLGEGTLDEMCLADILFLRPAD